MIVLVLRFVCSSCVPTPAPNSRTEQNNPAGVARIVLARGGRRARARVSTRRVVAPPRGLPFFPTRGLARVFFQPSPPCPRAPSPAPSAQVELGASSDRLALRSPTYASDCLANHGGASVRSSSHMSPVAALAALPVSGDGEEAALSISSLDVEGTLIIWLVLEAVELGFLLDLAEVLVYSARSRHESRGGHMREDYPDRDDEKFLVHTMAYLVGDPESADAGEHIKLGWKPVVITNYPPMERKY